MMNRFSFKILGVLVMSTLVGCQMEVADTESVEQNAELCSLAAKSVTIPVLKDASLIKSSLCCSNPENTNFGSAATVDVGWYHHDSQALLGYSLNKVPSSANVSKAELVVPVHSAVGSGVTKITINSVQNASPWDELTITRKTAPPSTFFATVGLTANAVNRLDVTELVRNAVRDRKTGISFLLTYSANNVLIDAKEKVGGKPTELYVAWN